MNNQTVEKLRNMRLGAMAQLHQQYVKENRFEGITCDEYLALLIDHQWEDRENNKIDRLLKLANFRQNASLGDINYASLETSTGVYQSNIWVRSLTDSDFSIMDLLIKEDPLSNDENIVIFQKSPYGISFRYQNQEWKLNYANLKGEL